MLKFVLNNRSQRVAKTVSDAATKSEGATTVLDLKKRVMWSQSAITDPGHCPLTQSIHINDDESPGWQITPFKRKIGYKLRLLVRNSVFEVSKANRFNANFEVQLVILNVANRY
jgi:hypothetical protein